MSEQSLDLSPTMQSAVQAMRDGGGLRRLPGGFWVRADGPAYFNRDAPWFGTSTMEALVSRGVAVYTEWFDNRFPIRCELNRVITPAPSLRSQK